MNETLLNGVVVVASVAAILGAARFIGFRVDVRSGIGGALLGLGVYLYPLGAIEAYDLTRVGFDLSNAANRILWYVITTVAIIVGLVLLRKPRSTT